MHAWTPRRFRILCALLGSTLAALVGAAGNALAAGSPGAVYIQSNTAPVNFVHVFPRATDGTLTVGPIVATGGSGSTSTPPFAFPILDSQGPVVLSQDGRLLFVTNAGSNTISSFRVTKDGLALVDQEASRGSLPISASVTNRGIAQKLLYVLNENPLPCFPFPVGCGSAPGTLSGYSVDSSGEMTPLPDGVRPVSGSVSAQVGFDSHGNVVTVTNRGNSTISTYLVRSDGSLGPERVTSATGATEPFGFEYTKRDQLIVSDTGPIAAPLGTASSYELDGKSAALTPIDTKPSGGLATCWVAITDDNRHAFMTNALSFNISRFALSAGGMLTLLGTTPAPGASLDEDTSNDSRYLYVLTADVAFSPFPVIGAGAVTGYEIGSDGSLTPIGTIPALPSGSSGLAAR